MSVEEIRFIANSDSFRELIGKQKEQISKVLLSTSPVTPEELDEKRRDWLALNRLVQNIEKAAKKAG